MKSIITPKVECNETNDVYGRFTIEPLERGFGITIGNAMRRVLLSSLLGAAVTWVRIDGVQHEYAAISDVKEDTAELLLNIKAIRLRPLSEHPGRLSLEVAGEGRVSAGDIKPSADFEVVNPELHLATLDSPNARLSVEFNVELGKGYVPAGQADGLPIGVLPVDAIFTPIRKVNYVVEQTRVGHVTDYDRLVLEVWTDGTITPIEAVRQSAQILLEHFFLFSNLGKVVEAGVQKQPMAFPINPEHYNIPIEQLGLSVRTLNCLKRSGLNRVGEVLQKSKEELLAIRNFGEKSLAELYGRLQTRGVLPPEVEKADEGEQSEKTADEGQEERQ